MPGHARWVCLMIPVAKQLWLAIRSRPRAAGSNLTVSLRAGPELCSETGNRRAKKEKGSAKSRRRLPRSSLPSADTMATQTPPMPLL